MASKKPPPPAGTVPQKPSAQAPSRRTTEQATKLVARQIPAVYAVTPAVAPFRGNVSDIIAGMRNGISAQIAPNVAQRLGLSQDKLFETLRLPKSTMKARLGKAQLLSPVEQDRMYRADRLWERALAVFEDEEACRTWIKRENRTLGGEAPLALLDTEAGYELVLDTLGRIEYGVVS